MGELRHGRKRGLTLGMGDAGVLGAIVEILGISLANPPFIPCLPSQPMDGSFDKAQGAINRGFTERLTGALIPGRLQLTLKGNRLFDMKPFKRFEACALLKAKYGGGGIGLWITEYL